MLTRKQLDHLITKMTQIYRDIETALLNLIADYLKAGKIDNVQQIYNWQAQHIGTAINLAQTAGQICSTFQLKNIQDVHSLITNNAQIIDNDIRRELTKLTHKRVNGNLGTIITNNLQTLDMQIQTGFMGLVSRNVNNNTVANIYKTITDECVAEVVSGHRSLERAIDDNIYKQVAAGIPTRLVNRRGAVLSLEGYSRLCVQTAVNRTYEQIRMHAMQDYDVTLGLYSIHPASRIACAPIQHHVVNLVPVEDVRYDPEYDSIYNHGYGTPAGARGINCRHYIIPFVKGVNSVPKNPYPHLTTEQAIKNGELQQKQRSYERSIRTAKRQLAMAKRLQDAKGIQHYQELILQRQARIRKFVKKHKFLYRDYSREQIRSFPPNLRSSDRLTLSQKHVKMKIVNGEWGTKINTEKQAPHMESTHIEGKSYLYDDVDPQKLLDKYSGKGELLKDRKQRITNKEIVKTDIVVGKDARTNHETKWIKIHHSKTRTHIVPYIKKGDKNEVG